MVSTLQMQEKYDKIKKRFCFYLNIPDRNLAKHFSQRLENMGLREEVFLTSRVTHVVGSARASAPARCARLESRARADAMLERLRAQPQSAHPYVHLTVQKAINLLDKLYDTFLAAPSKAHVSFFSKHFIKIEFLDKACKPVYKEFDKWPRISLEPDKEKKDKKEVQAKPLKLIPSNNTAQKMTRKSRPRIKEKEEKEQKVGYCEMCNTDYVDAALHRRSPHHLAFVRDHTNFLALDSLISSGADVSTFLDKATPVNGERRSLRKLYNGETESKPRRSKRSQSPDNLNGNSSPKRNGIEDESRHKTRCSKKSSDSQSDNRQYYKVVGVSTKLRSSGGFRKMKESPPAFNGTKPLVVKFRKVRRSELSVLSDEAEQFMFPRRASSSSSSSSDDEEKDEVLSRRRKTQPQPLVSIERQRLARPIGLKEESSEEDSWHEDKRRRKRRGPTVAKRARCVPPPAKAPVVEEPPVNIPVPTEPPAPKEPEVCPLREQPSEKCMKWEDGKLKYTPAVEQLEFAFELIPHSEPWYETFKRQDEDKVVAKNIPQFFELYSKSPKLPYEIGQLPPLKPNCCPLSDLVKREEKPGPSRSYGTRGMKQQRIRKRTAAIMALESHPRKSPREHASTLAILGSAGLLHRRKHVDDSKSTASEDTVSDTHSTVKVEPVISENQEASERLKLFLSEVYYEANDYDFPDDLLEADAAIIASKNIPDVSSLVSECDDCDLIQKEIKQCAISQRPGRRGKFKKKNRTGWPSKKHFKKSSRASSAEIDHKADDSLDRSSAEPPDDDTTQESISEEEQVLSEAEKDESTLIEGNLTSDDSQATVKNDSSVTPMDVEQDDKHSEDQPLSLAVKAILAEKNAKIKDCEKKEKFITHSSASESEDKDDKSKKKKRSFHELSWLQPVVRVARVDPEAGRRLRSAGRSRTSRYR